MGPHSQTRLSDFHLDTTPEEDACISHFIGGHIEALKSTRGHKTGIPCFFFFENGKNLYFLLASN